MFERIREENSWQIGPAPVSNAIQAHACIEINLPIKSWRCLFRRSDGFNGPLGPDAETWEFRHEQFEDHYALGAIYKDEERPVVFLTEPTLINDFMEYLKEGLSTLGPGHNID